MKQSDDASPLNKCTFIYNPILDHKDKREEHRAAFLFLYIISINAFPCSKRAPKSIVLQCANFIPTLWTVHKFYPDSVDSTKTPLEEFVAK